jgi:hypothetical protein
MADDGGVLGNLPRSRPGQRSDKRTGKTAAKAAGRAERTGAKAAEPAAGAKSAAGARSAGQRGAPAAAGRKAAPASAGADPVGGAIRTVAGVAGLGAKVAGGVAREVLRRLPRP